MTAAARCTGPDLVECSFASAATPGDDTRLTWSQRFMWDVIVATGGPAAEFDFLLVRDFPTPITVDDAVDLVRRFLLRHAVVRSTISRAPDGEPVLHVPASATVSVPLLRGDWDESTRLRPLVPGTTFTQLCRPAFLLAGDAVARIAMRISHLATDAWGLRLLDDDFAALPTGGDGPAADETLSPLDLARFEGSPGGLRVQRRATDLAAELYAAAPPTMWPRPRRRAEPERFWFGWLRSADLLAAMATLTEERRLRRAGILAGALATVAASAGGLDSALLFAISSNRFDSGWRAYPGSLSQEAILHLPVAELTKDTMRGALIPVMRSLQNARYAPAVMAEVRRAAEWHRGVWFDKLGSAIVLNLLADEPAVRTPPAHGGPTTFAWSGSTNEENLGFYVDAHETESEFVLGIRVDTRLLSPDEAETWVRAMEWTIISSAARDLTAAHVRSYLADRGAATGDGPRVLLVGCERVVAEASGAEAVRVQRRGADLVCYLAGPRHVATPEQAHAAVMAALPAAQPAVAPTQYVMLREAPAEPADDDAWACLPVVSRGSGR